MEIKKFPLIIMKYRDHKTFIIEFAFQICIGINKKRK